MDIESKIPSINKHLKSDYKYIEPNEMSHKGLCVPQIIADYGNLLLKIRSFPRVGKYMIGSIYEMKKSYNSLYNQPIKASTMIKEQDLSDLKSFCKELDILDIGFTTVNPSYIFSNKKILYDKAIVVSYKMNYSIISTAPSKPVEREIFRTYYKLNYAVNKIKEFLNSKGYNAQAGPALGGEVSYPLLAQDASIGEIGKHGLLISPQGGPSIRLAAVYTDIENLPIKKENGHLWVKDFCDKCNRCVTKCPGDAIFKKTKILDDGTKKHIDYKKCAIPFSRNYGCTVCVKECVFFINSYEKVKSSFFSKN